MATATSKLEAVVTVVGGDFKQKEVCRLSVGPDGSVVSSVKHFEASAILRTAFYSRDAGRRVTAADGEAFLRVLPGEYGCGSRVRVGLVGG